MQSHDVSPQECAPNSLWVGGQKNSRYKIVKQFNSMEDLYISEISITFHHMAANLASHKGRSAEFPDSTISELTK